MISDYFMGTGKKKYPCLCKHWSDEYIVLFQEEKMGTVVWSTSEIYKLGHQNFNWSMNQFREIPKSDTIELKNS